MLLLYVDDMMIVKRDEGKISDVEEGSELDLLNEILGVAKTGKHPMYFLVYSPLPICVFHS